jgi:hypothetical protein
MSITPRDLFEAKYAKEFLPFDSYREAKAMLEENRQGDTYSDSHVAKKWEDELLGVPW